MALRITCINKAGGYHEDPHEAIQFLGWINEVSQETGRSSRLDMYEWIVAGGEAYVGTRLGRPRVIAAVTSRGTKYVKTVANHTTSDNLLSLPECA